MAVRLGVMETVLTTPQEYLDSLSGSGKEWLAEFLDYMREKHSDVKPVMFRQRPMFKAGESYVFFTVAKEHFSVHTLNFGLIEGLKAKLTKADFGKGCVKVKFSDESAKPVLRELCDEIIRLNLQSGAVDTNNMQEPPYDQKLANAFSGSKAKWLSLYEMLRDRVKAVLPDFVEYFPAVNVLWKHTSTFAQVSAVAGALRVEFYSDNSSPERNAVKMMQTSKNRVAHTVEITDDRNIDDILRWIAESYTLTLKI